MTDPVSPILYIMDTAPLLQPELFRHLYESVPDFRKESIDKIRPQSGKALSLGVSLLLVRALEEAGIPDPEFGFNEHGKPFLRGSSLRFNLSHSGERAVCLVSDRECGCDTEKVRDANLKIATRYFSPPERDLLLSLSDSDEQNRMFFRLWTLKESFMKATGLGFSLPMSGFSIRISGDSVSVDQTSDPFSYSFSEFDFGDGYRYACCFRLDNKKNDGILPVAPVFVSL